MFRNKNIKFLQMQMSYLLKKDYSEQTDHIDFGNIMNNL